MKACSLIIWEDVAKFKSGYKVALFYRKEVLNGTPMGVSTRTYWHPQGVSIRTYWHPLEIIMELLNQLILNLSRVQGVLQGVLQGYYVMILLGVLQWVAI